MLLNGISFSLYIDGWCISGTFLYSRCAHAHGINTSEICSVSYKPAVRAAHLLLEVDQLLAGVLHVQLQGGLLLQGHVQRRLQLRLAALQPRLPAQGLASAGTLRLVMRQR